MIDKSKFQLHPDLVGEDDEETQLLQPMAEEALSYIRGFKWCPPIKGLYLAYGVGGVLALFLVEFERPIGNGPDKDLWIVVGDLPPAYFVTEGAPDPLEALDTYCFLMEDWADAVLKKRNLSQFYPVQAEPTADNARMLKGRMEFIREKLIPHAAETYSPTQ
jgi:hypothetical protein